MGLKVISKGHQDADQNSWVSFFCRWEVLLDTQMDLYITSSEPATPSSSKINNFSIEGLSSNSLPISPQLNEQDSITYELAVRPRVNDL